LRLPQVDSFEEKNMKKGRIIKQYDDSTCGSRMSKTKLNNFRFVEMVPESMFQPNCLIVVLFQKPNNSFEKEKF